MKNEKKDIPAVQKKKLEFTKVILRACMIAYISTIVYGYVYYIFTDFTMDLNSLFAFVGAPTVTAIGFYAWKAKAENIVKYPKETQEQIKEEIQKSEEGMQYDRDDSDIRMGYPMSYGSFDSPCATFAESEKQEYRVAEMGSERSRETTGWGNGSA